MKAALPYIFGVAVLGGGAALVIWAVKSSGGPAQAPSPQYVPVPAQHDTGLFGSLGGALDKVTGSLGLGALF